MHAKDGLASVRLHAYNLLWLPETSKRKATAAKKMFSVTEYGKCWVNLVHNSMSVKPTKRTTASKKVTVKNT